MSFGNHDSISPIMDSKGISFVTADSAAAFKLGTRVVVGGEEYVFVHNILTGTALAPGYLLTLSGATGYSLTLSTVAAADAPLCVVKHQTFPSAGYGWGLVRGMVDVHIVSTLAAGVLLGVGADGEAMTHLAGSFGTGLCIGKTLSNATSDSRCPAYVRLFG